MLQIPGKVINWLASFLSMTRNAPQTIVGVNISLKVSLWNIMDFGGGFGPSKGCRWTPISTPENWISNLSHQDEIKFAQNELMSKSYRNVMREAQKNKNDPKFFSYAVYVARLYGLADEIIKEKADVVILLELLTGQKRVSYKLNVHKRYPTFPLLFGVVKIISSVQNYLDEPHQKQLNKIKKDLEQSKLNQSSRSLRDTTASKQNMKYKENLTDEISRLENEIKFY